MFKIETPAETFPRFSSIIVLKGTKVPSKIKSPQGQSRSDVLSESKIMADSVEIQFVDESEFQNEGIKNSQLELVRTSRKTYFHFRLRLKITLEESTYSSQCP